MDKTNIAKILSEATIPNSSRSLLSVIINVAKPDAVVTLVINVALPILVITLCSDLALFPCSLTSCWYLLIRKIQLGIPITIISGGISPVRTDISKSPGGVFIIKSPNIPTDHTTPTITTNNEMKVAL